MLDISPEELGSALVAEYTTTRGSSKYYFLNIYTVNVFMFAVGIFHGFYKVNIFVGINFCVIEKDKYYIVLKINLVGTILCFYVHCEN